MIGCLKTQAEIRESHQHATMNYVKRIAMPVFGNKCKAPLITFLFKVKRSDVIFSRIKGCITEIALGSITHNLANTLIAQIENENPGSAREIFDV